MLVHQWFDIETKSTNIFKLKFLKFNVFVSIIIYNKYKILVEHL